MRPKAKEKRVSFTIMLRPSLANEYERLADKLHITKGQLMSNALEIALDDIHMLEALGVVRAVGGVRKLQEEMKGWRDRGVIEAPA
jgi:hypothetical protein